MLDFGHVLLRDTLRDGNYEGNFILNCVKDGISAEGGWDVDNGCVGLDALHCLGYGVEDGKVEVGGAAFLGGDAAYHIGSVFDGLLAVECSLLSSESLTNDTGILI